MSGSSQPLVSVIMNCYNSELYLKESIDSIYAQTYSNLEIIFWDNASTDKSSEIAKSYDNKLKYFLAQKNTNLGEARNAALENAQGKYIAFLDCDDLFLENKLKSSCQWCFLEFAKSAPLNLTLGRRC